MKDLDRALSDITAIRSQLARGTEVRGYGPITVAATGLLALLAAALQALLLPDPAATLLAYLALWVGMAALAVLLTGAEMIARTRRIHGGFADEMLYAAVEQFIPAGVAGTLVTVVLYRFASDALWMLPGCGRSCSASACSRPAARCRAACSPSASGISLPGLRRSRLRAARRSPRSRWRCRSESGSSSWRS